MAMVTKAKTRKMNKIIGLKELRENMATYIRAVESGKSFTVIRRSRPVFKLEPVDEWGDEGVWQNVVDFTKIKSGGVPIEDAIASLKHLNAKAR